MFVLCFLMLLSCSLVSHLWFCLNTEPGLDLAGLTFPPTVWQARSLNCRKCGSDPDATDVPLWAMMTLFFWNFLVFRGPLIQQHSFLNCLCPAGRRWRPSSVDPELLSMPSIINLICFKRLSLLQCCHLKLNLIFWTKIIFVISIWVSFSPVLVPKNKPKKKS